MKLCVDIYITARLQNELLTINSMYPLINQERYYQSVLGWGDACHLSCGFINIQALSAL